MKKLLLLTSIALLLSCSGDNSEVIATVNDKDIMANDFDAYLAFKRIQVRDDKHRSALLSQYAEREALSLVIEESLDEKARAANRAELEIGRAHV